MTRTIFFLSKIGFFDLFFEGKREKKRVGKSGVAENPAILPSLEEPQKKKCTFFFFFGDRLHSEFAAFRLV